jgi:hypothetical protein
MSSSDEEVGGTAAPFNFFGSDATGLVDGEPFTPTSFSHNSIHYLALGHALRLERMIYQCA